MARIYIKYFTKEKLDKISAENKNLYDKYLKSCIVKNRDVEETTYKNYKNYFYHFLAFLAEKYDNVGLYSDVFTEECIDVLEDYMLFCQDTLGNHKKIINTKLSAISSFYQWSVKRGYLKFHPFDGKLTRMQGADDEKLINHYFLTRDEIQKMRVGLTDKPYDIQDQILFEIIFYSANRIGAISKLILSKLKLEDNMFIEIREKRGKIVEVPFDNVAKDLIEEWIEIRKQEMDNLSVDSLFITKIKEVYQPMTKQTLQERIRRIGKIIGLDDFHAHCARKTVGNLVYLESGDMTLSQELLNHADISTTQKSYIKPKSKKEVMEKIKSFRDKI